MFETVTFKSNSIPGFLFKASDETLRQIVVPRCIDPPHTLFVVLFACEDDSSVRAFVLSFLLFQPLICLNFFSDFSTSPLRSLRILTFCD
ncbi:hypothetical protein E2C01_055550 [Portunus trituberculatus]|uniref:Uncharacterized protein n=1 Tax=Portunus trituberculatus TaxID=210409 RepID=A0A5B7GX55_PORTR|nr:hypothetical protein [Portunus trituberculatus]